MPSKNFIKKNNIKIVELLKNCFKQNLIGIVLHGSVLSKKTSIDSDIDVLVITKTSPNNFKKRNELAQEIKKESFVLYPPYSFDFCTIEELKKAIREQHPFIISIVIHHKILFDPSSKVGKILQKMPAGISLKNQKIWQFSKNYEWIANQYLVLHKMYLKAALFLLNKNEYAISLICSNQSIRNAVKCFLSQNKLYVARGEIYQLYLNLNKNSKNITALKKVFLKKLMPLNQLASIIESPNIYIPKQKVSWLIRNISKKEASVALKLAKEIINLNKK